MKKYLLLLVLFFTFSLSSSAQVYLSLDSISSPLYICQATAFNVDVYGTRSNGEIQNGPQNYSLRNDTIFINFYFQRGLGGTPFPSPILRQILIQAPPVGQYKIFVKGIYSSLTSVNDTINSRISVCSGIAGNAESLKEDIKIDIYPNPTEDKLTLTGFSPDTKLLKAAILDFTGKVCQQVFFNPEQKKEINIKTLAKGIYLLHLQTEKGLIVKRLVKQ